MKRTGEEHFEGKLKGKHGSYNPVKLLLFRFIYFILQHKSWTTPLRFCFVV